MSALEILNLFITVATASCLIVRPALINRVSKPIVAILVSLSCLQLLISGYSWRYLPGYILIFLVALWALAGHNINKVVVKRILQFTLVVSLPFVLLPWSIFLAVPHLPQPMGPHRLGTKIFRWVDLSRDEEITPDTLDRRNVIVQVWYPTEPEANGSYAAYLDGLGKLPDNVDVIPSAMFDRYDQINTHAVVDAPISTTEARWPVVLFLTGNGASRSFYTSLITHIASLGYVVLAIDHPYDATIAQLADGSVVTNVEQYLPQGADRLKFITLRAKTRIADVKFVVDELVGRLRSDNFFSHLDVDRIVIAGHSLGGASGAMAMAFDPRIKAAVNIDGTTYGELPETRSPRPFLLIESKKDTSDRFLRYEQGNQKLFQHFAGGSRYELSEADHYSFTDAPLLLTLPARSLVSHFFGVGNVPEQTYRSTAAIVAAFFSGALQGNRIDLDSVAGKYEDVIKKSISPPAQGIGHTE
jgi:predicted dienelactone hydrolase